MKVKTFGPAIVGTMSIVSIVVLTTSSTLLAAEGPITAFLDEPKFELRQLFTGGRLPNVAVATDGTVLATWGATGGGGDWSGKGLEVRLSTDGGATWSESTSIANPGWQGGGLTVDETSGHIFAFAEHWKWPKAPPPPTVYVSTDHGRSWKARKTVIHPDKKGNMPSMHMAEHGITLLRGKHKGRLLRPARNYEGSDIKEKFPKHYNTAIYSDDGGKTWKTSDPFPALGTGEGAVAELSDGRIYYNSRRHWDPKGLKLMRWEAWSEDAGATWKDLAISKVLPDGALGNGSNGCLAGLIRLPVRGRDILLYSNCDNATKQRKNVSVWVSFDGAKTWPIKRSVFAGPSAYSSLSVGRPGTPSAGWIYILLEGGKKHRYGGGQFARFNLSWLLDGEKTGDGTVPDWVDASVKAPRGSSAGDGLIAIFDGKTLDGWHTVPKESATDWTVRDGVIVGQGTIATPSYLVWKDEQLRDFELELSYRLPGKGNTGIDIRRQPALSGRRAYQSYHADIGHAGIGPHILGVWDFHFTKRKEPAHKRGTRLIIDEDGEAHATPLAGAVTLADIRAHQWNDVRIVARGNHFQFFINGKPAYEFTDNAKQGQLKQGAIALQIHDKEMRVEFKNVRLKRLDSTPD